MNGPIWSCPQFVHHYNTLLIRKIITDLLVYVLSTLELNRHGRRYALSRGTYANFDPEASTGWEGEGSETGYVHGVVDKLSEWKREKTTYKRVAADIMMKTQTRHDHV